jgi:hypothetical protein
MSRREILCLMNFNGRNDLKSLIILKAPKLILGTLISIKLAITIKKST